MPMQIRRTSAADTPPTGLAEGQLAVEMASAPPRLWLGVAAAINPTGRIRLNLPAVVGTAPANPQLGDLYWDDDSGQLFVRDAADQWVVAVNQPQSAKIPTVQRFISGSGTYTPMQGVQWIRVRMIAGGGGGATAGGVTPLPSAGGATSFGGWICNGGQPGGQAVGTGGGLGGAGGTGGSNGTGALVMRMPGGKGSQGLTNAGTATTSYFAFGAGTPFGFPDAPNSGCGGQGGASSVPALGGGGGGGAGEYAEFLISAPSATVYAVGAGGIGAGDYFTQIAEAVRGQSGQIVVEENY